MIPLPLGFRVPARRPEADLYVIRFISSYNGLRCEAHLFHDGDHRWLAAIGGGGIAHPPEIMSDAFSAAVKQIERLTSLDLWFGSSSWASGVGRVENRWLRYDDAA